MKILLLNVCIGLSITAMAQTNHTINAVGNTWSPNSLTIDVGDSVTFINANQGSHNVNGTTATYPSNPESFSMLTTGSNWTYGHRFNIAGTYTYRCNVHSSIMTGTITVLGSAALEENVVSSMVYPNPIDNVLNLQVDATDYEVSIFDIYGNLVMNKYLSLENQLNLSQLNSGSYILKINRNGELETHRIIKN